jgi:uncharacterized protein
MKNLARRKMIQRLLLGVGATSGVSLFGCASGGASSGETFAASKARIERIDILSAGKGSAFLPYAQGLASVFATQKISAVAVETAGSIENIRKLNSMHTASAPQLATVFLGTAHEAVMAGAAWTQSQRFENIRALFPMYETSFQCVSLREKGIDSLAKLQGRRVGVGPQNGPAENYFRGASELAGVTATLVNGTPAALVEDLLANKIDALWQGASVPIPAIKQVTDARDAIVFGLDDALLEKVLARFPVLARTSVPANAYRGQARPLASVAAWNFVMVHKDFDEALAYGLLQALFGATPLAVHASAATTRLEHVQHNRVVPFHPGALRFYRERGVRLSSA